MLNEMGTQETKYTGRSNGEDHDHSWMKSEKDLTSVAQEIDQHLQVMRHILKRPLECEFAPHELTGPQRSVMQAVVQSTGLSLKDLSKTVGLAHSTVSGIVDRLEKQGLVRRLAGEQDRRLTRIVVTQAVVEFMRNHTPDPSNAPLITALGNATEGEQASILEGMRKLRGLLESQRRSNRG